MKSLTQFIKEAQSEKSNFSFSFAGLDDAKDVLQQLNELDCCEVIENDVTVKAEKGSDCTQQAYDILKEYSNKQRKSQHRSSDENYAQKTVKFEDAVNALDEFMNASDEEEKPEPKEEESKEEKVCPKCGKSCDKCDCKK